MSDIIVKVVRNPGVVAEVCLSSGATVQDALNEADLTPAHNEVVTRNGQKTSLSATLNDGDRVIVAAEAKSAY